MRIYIDKRYDLHYKLVDRSDVDPRLIAIIEDCLKDILKTYPIIVEYLKFVSSDNLDESVFADISDDDSFRLLGFLVIRINNKYWSNYDILMDCLKKEESLSGTAIGELIPKDIINHEIGHAAYSICKMERKRNYNLIILLRIYNFFSYTIRKMLKKNKRFGWKAISFTTMVTDGDNLKYIELIPKTFLLPNKRKDDHEAFAEGFMALFSSNDSLKKQILTKYVKRMCDKCLTCQEQKYN